MAAKRTEEPAFSHLDRRGKARMVDVGEKAQTLREAVAVGEVKMAPATVEAIREGAVPKGDVLAVARIAGIQGAKQTAHLIPLCHPLSLDAVDVGFAFGPDRVFLRARARVQGRTGVEMEALVAVTTAALALYDMCKSADKGMELGPFALVHKSGGRSGVFARKRKWGGPPPEEEGAWE